MRSILITGGSGFFGRAFAQRLLSSAPTGRLVQRICIFSRGEHAQAEMRESLADPDERMRYFIGDVRDSDRLQAAMQGIDTVIHAAALKRIEACAYNPGEAVATNILGAQNVIKGARAAGVARVVALSSDKACEPTTLYGSTKHTAEGLFLAANQQPGTKFAVVRYGNVAGSTGSVIPRWRARNGVAYISDAEATRFWMTAEQAVDLVLMACRTMPTSVLIPDLPAYRLGDLATAMGVQITKVVGLAPGEKLHERMIEGGPTSAEVRRLSLAELEAGLELVSCS